MRRDLTELAGLDDLTAPESVIAQIEGRAARRWNAESSLISLAGASGGLMASIAAVARSGRKKILLPRNSHRSVVNALIFSGLIPIWFEPTWDPQWNQWGHVTPQSIEILLQKDDADDCAALVLVSPTYGGAVSDVAGIARLCKQSGIPLIVDQAHGAHLLEDSGMPLSAVAHADVTVLSLHKTLSAFTQTGIVHVSARGSVSIDDIRTAMNLMHSSSPSYPLMISIEETVALLERPEGMCLLANMKLLADQVRERLRETGLFEVYNAHFDNDPAHVLFRHKNAAAEEIDSFLQERRIFGEALIGSGLLLMLGIGSAQSDVDALFDALKQFDGCDLPKPSEECQLFVRPAEVEQIFSPREAFFMPSEVVPIQEAVGRIAQECVAPCPPGIPLTIPGQRVHPEVMNVESLRCLRVVKQ